MELRELTDEMNRFVATMGWYGKDSPKPQIARNLAISLCVEAAEILELYQWQEAVVEADLASELADVMLYLLQLASVAGIDLETAVMEKLQTNYGRAW